MKLANFGYRKIYANIHLNNPYLLSTSEPQGLTILSAPSFELLHNSYLKQRIISEHFLLERYIMVKSKKCTQIPNADDKKINSKAFEKFLKDSLAKSSAHVSENMKIGRSTIINLNQNQWGLKTTDLPVASCYLCPICTTMYNTISSEPICLPCGHSFCRTCVFNLKHSLLLGHCPFDSKEFYYIEELLPINYALLNSSIDPFSRICPNHKLSILGFCKEDCSLLCGKCIFAHNSHDFVELDSLLANELAENQFLKLKSLEEKLKKLLLTWEDYKVMLLKTEEKIKKVVSNHVANLRKIEAEIVLEIHSRTDRLIKCCLDYQEIITAKDEENADHVIECIKYHLKSAESLESMYSFMNTCDKLSLCVNYDVKFEFPKEISVKEIVGKLLEDLKYRELILCGTT